MKYKKILAILLALMLALSLASCGGSSSGSDSSDSGQDTEAVTDETAETEEEAEAEAEAEDGEDIEDIEFQNYYVEEMVLHLPTDFSSYPDLAEENGLTDMLVSEEWEISIMVLREAKEDIEPLYEENIGETLDLDSYAVLIHDNVTDRETTDVEDDGDLRYFDFEYDVGSGSIFGYRAYMMESDEAYWLVQFYTPAEYFEDAAPLFTSVAHAIYFN